MFTRSQSRREALLAESETEDEYVDASPVEEENEQGAETWIAEISNNLDGLTEHSEAASMTTTDDEGDTTVISRDVTRSNTKRTPNSRRLSRARSKKAPSGKRRSTVETADLPSEGNPPDSSDQTGIISTMKTFMCTVSDTMKAMNAMKAMKK